MMLENLEQVAALIGAVLVLVAYAAQRFRRISAEGAPYLMLNFIGGALLCGAAVYSRQLGFIILEGAWALISLIGLLRLQREG